jgi:hypothetical protein
MLSLAGPTLGTKGKQLRIETVPLVVPLHCSRIARMAGPLSRFAMA